MIIKDAKFVCSNTDFKKLPDKKLPEYAFIGRSNVGKSSLINMLLNRKELALTSSKPGKTQTINHFIINQSWYIVDLPGYGYAKVSQDKRKNWGEMIGQYINERQTLQCVFVLVDGRIEPQKNDIEFINSLGKSNVPVIIIFTKTDKEKKLALISKINLFKQALQRSWESLPTMIISSAFLQTGKDSILEIIEETNQHFFQTKKN